MGEIRSTNRRSLQIALLESSSPPLRSSDCAVDYRGLGSKVELLPKWLARRSLLPVNEALVRRPGSDQPVERDDERTDRGRALREPIRVENDDPVVRAILTAEPAIELKKVVPVVGHQRPLGRLGVRENVLVCKTPKLAALTDRFDLAVACPELLGHLRLLLVDADPLVDLSGVLAVVADRVTHLPHRKTRPFGRRLHPVVPLETGRAHGDDDLPDVRAGGKARPPTGWSITEHDPGVVVHPHPLVDVTLGKPRFVQTRPSPAALKPIHDAGVQPSGELARSSHVRQCNASCDRNELRNPGLAYSKFVRAAAPALDRRAVEIVCGRGSRAVEPQP